MNWVKSHKFEVTLFLCAFVIRLSLFIFNFSQSGHELIPTIKGDDGYYELSQSLVHDRGFTWDLVPPYSPNPLRPPVWPMLIAFFAKIFGSYWAVLVFELVLGSCIPVLGMKIVQKIIGEKLAKVVGFMMTLEPYLVLLSFILYTETSFTFFFLLFVLFIFRYFENNSIRNAVWSGVFLGLAILIKPTVQYFPILIPITLAIMWRKKLSIVFLKHLCVFLTVVGLMVFPWLYRNHKEFDVWGMSAQPAFNLYVYLVPTVLAIDNNSDFRTEYLSFVKKDGFDENSINLSNSNYFKQKAFEVLYQHKLALVKSSVITAITFFTHDGMLTFMGYSGITFPNVVTKPAITLITHPIELAKLIWHYASSPAITIIVMRLVWIVITLLSFTGAYLYLRKENVKQYAIVAVLIILYFMITTAINGFGVNARFRVPVDVFIFSFAVYCFFVIKERISLVVAKRHA